VCKLINWISLKGNLIIKVRLSPSRPIASRSLERDPTYPTLKPKLKRKEIITF
jgi:hypothetical protein